MKNIFRIGSLNFVSNQWWFIRFLNLNIISLLFRLINNFVFNYPSSTNLSYLWNFGFLAIICLMIQIVSGIFLSMHYVADVTLAFANIEHIIRDVNYGWFIRYIHLNGASFFFYSCLFTYFPWILLFILYVSTSISVSNWNNYLNFNDFNCFFRLCITLRTNEFLSCNNNYEFSFFNSNYRNRYYILNLRRVCS